MPRDHYLPDPEFRAMVLAIAKMMEGLCVDQIEHVLRAASKLCAQGAIFTTESTAFKVNLNVAETPPQKQ